MGRPGRQGVLDEPQLPGCRREVTQRGLAAVGRRSPRRCQGNGSSAGRGPARLGLARPGGASAWPGCTASPLESEPEPEPEASQA